MIPGLEVDALQGQPGAYSARYAGPQRDSEDNMRLLLEKLGDQSNRAAQFRTVITLWMDDRMHQFEGVVRGTIALERSGEGRASAMILSLSRRGAPAVLLR